MKVRDRIKELRRVKASELRPSPRNWRTHPQAQLDALRGVLAEVGIAGAAIGRELEDGTVQLIDGHARAETLGDGLLPVLVLDVTEEEADKLLATYDPLGAMAGADAGKLEALLNDVVSFGHSSSGLRSVTILFAAGPYLPIEATSTPRSCGVRVGNNRTATVRGVPVAVRRGQRSS